MSRPLLILRPEPGAGESAARAEALGLDPVTAPLFTIRPVRWDAPDPSLFDAVLLTSAHAARLAGEQLDRFTALPCFTTGEASADAARAAGFAHVHPGPADGAAALSAAAAAGASRILHLCGRDHVALAHHGVMLERRIVHLAEAVAELPAPAAHALAEGALALLHSPRAGRLFGELVDRRGLARTGIDIAAISDAAAEAAGPGWRSKSVASVPRDQALLELAAKLCNTGAR